MGSGKVSAMMKRVLMASAIVLILATTAACFGPKPTVLTHELQPPEQPGQPWVLYATVENRGRGEGQVAVTARLLDPETGDVLAENETTAQFRGHETITVAIELQPPTDGPFEEEVEAEYPT